MEHANCLRVLDINCMTVNLLKSVKMKFILLCSNVSAHRTREPKANKGSVCRMVGYFSFFGPKIIPNIHPANAMHRGPVSRVYASNCLTDHNSGLIAARPIES